MNSSDLESVHENIVTFVEDKSFNMVNHQVYDPIIYVNIWNDYIRISVFEVIWMFIPEWIEDAESRFKKYKKSNLRY